MISHRATALCAVMMLIFCYRQVYDPPESILEIYNGSILSETPKSANSAGSVVPIYDAITDVTRMEILRRDDDEYIIELHVTTLKSMLMRAQVLAVLEYQADMDAKPTAKHPPAIMPPRTPPTRNEFTPKKQVR